jgi:FtsZ-interacting cell division protein YlmF
MKIKFTRKPQENGFEEYGAYDEYNGGFGDNEELGDEGFVSSDFNDSAVEEAPAAVAPIALKIINPKEYDKAKASEIADFLMNGNTVLLNIENLEQAHILRYLDYLSGATHAVGGMMTRVGRTTIVVSPKNVDVSSIEAMVGSDE